MMFNSCMILKAPEPFRVAYVFAVTSVLSSIVFTSLMEEEASRVPRLPIVCPYFVVSRIVTPPHLLSPSHFTSPRLLSPYLQAMCKIYFFDWNVNYRLYHRLQCALPYKIVTRLSPLVLPI